MDDIIFGARILDVLTTGMYPDALDAIREYIQNSFDAIRRAEYAEILRPNFGEVMITIDAEERVVTIRDNGIGLPAADARTTLLSIGASKKKIGDDAGFRGIGRLAGLAYCDKVVFTTASKNEALQTELTFDAAAIRTSIAPTSSAEDIETAAELLTRLTKHRQADRPPGEPFFEVKLIGVDPKACPFLEYEEVRKYLRQVAPVEFNMQAFVYGASKINPFLDAHSARKTINLTLEFNGRRDKINKPYKTFYAAGNRTDNRVDIIDIETYADPSDPPRWIAWLSKPRNLTGTINAEDVRGIRLRANNIQIGDYNTFSRIFGKIRKTHSRFNGWFAGEVHVLDPRIVPNSRRDFFEDTEAWREAERTLIEWAKELARRAYQNSSDRNRPIELIEGDADEFIEEFEKETGQGFTSESEREQALQDITDRERSIDKAISPSRTDEENEALRRKKEEIARLRQQAAKPKSLIDESELNRHERRVLRFVMNIVYKICGAESAKLVAEEINSKLKEKARKKNANAPQGAREDDGQEFVAPSDEL
jgi:molecular chaperone HtpG